MINKKNVIIASIVSFVCLVVIVILCILNVSANNNYSQNIKKLNDAENTRKSVENKYSDKYAGLSKDYSNVIKNSNDPKIYSVSYNSNTYSNAYDRVGKFLEKYFTYDSQKSFLERKSYLLDNGLATKSLINSDKFKNPKDSSGASYIDATGLKTKFVDFQLYGDFGSKKSVIPIIVKATFTSGYSGSWTSTASNMYKLSYNQFDGSVGSIDKLSTVNVDSSQ